MSNTLNPISLDFSTSQVMGIINVTPDSFYDGGTNSTNDAVILTAEKHLKEGATILDIGGMSSRPGAELISEEEELSRVIPALQLVLKYFPSALISIDTFRGKVAEEALSNGASIINDISAGRFDESIVEVVAKRKCPYIIMHMQGIPQNMQQNPSYENVVKEVKAFFEERVAFINRQGVTNLILDVGFGFGKTVAHNYQLLSCLKEFKSSGYPILAGVSRKSMLTKLLEITIEQSLNATTVANTLALVNGANILRVHDVKEAVEAVRIYNATKKN
jgi:dihydropteroate synthase